MHQGSGTIEPSDYFLLVLLLLPQDISAAWRVSARGQTHRLQPLRMLQRDESHRLLLFCRSIVSFYTDTSRTLTGAIATATWQCSWLRAQNCCRCWHSLMAHRLLPPARRRCGCCVHHGSGVIDSSDYLPLVLVLLPQDI